MPPSRQLKPIVSQPGQPLYQAVKEAIRAAVDSGAYKPGEQIPSTKDLSEQLRVSLVTAHRALQELVAAGVLQRAQGRGTFVHERYFDKERTTTDYRVGLVFQNGAPLADLEHAAILEGIHEGAAERAVDLLILRFGEDVRNECNGYLCVNPIDQHLPSLARRASKRQPLLVVGARSRLKGIASFDMDNVGLARTAVKHLAQLGHVRIGYVGGAGQLGSSRDRREGFLEACRELGLDPEPQHVIKCAGERVEQRDRDAVLRLLQSPRRPTAVFAAGHSFALSVYAAATIAGLRIPADLSVIGVDDPESAAHLSPPLTTLRQPLIEMGKAAVTALWECMRHDTPCLESKLLHADLIVRKSTAAPAAS